MAEHAAENRGVGSSILPLATDFSDPRLSHALMLNAPVPGVRFAGRRAAVQPASS